MITYSVFFFAIIPFAGLSTSVAEAEAELKKLLPAAGDDDDIDPKDCEANTLKRNK